VADFRAGGAFVTLDYSDGECRRVQRRAVTLEDMKCQLLRDDEQIKASAGKYRGKLDALECPSCGTAIKYLPGVTTNLVCPSCQAQLDAAGPQAQMLAKARTSSACAPPSRSARGQDLGNEYRSSAPWCAPTTKAASGPNTCCTAPATFFWLVETDEGWSRASVMPSWPQWMSTSARTTRLDNVSYNKLYDYPATVQYAAGAFNWRVAAGDVVRVFEFETARPGWRRN
jgi:hypothetical protein